MDAMIANTPVEKPPPGQQPNFIDPENLSAVFISLVSIANLLALVFVVLRIYARVRLRTLPTADDCEYLNQRAGDY